MNGPARAARSGNIFRRIKVGCRQAEMPHFSWRMRSRILGWCCRILGSRRSVILIAFILSLISLSLIYLRNPQFRGGAAQDEKDEHGRPKVVDLPRLLPPARFNDTPLPPGHPCHGFTLPPPPADKKRTGPRPCPVCYLPVDEAAQLYPPRGAFPELVLKELSYVHNVAPSRSRIGSDFGGQPTLEDRNRSFNIRESMKIHCGFARGTRPGVASGFDLDARDLWDMEQCHGVIVTSAIFGNFDPMQQPKNISDTSKRDVCFFMFVDEVTEAAINKDENYLFTRKVGLWRIVTIRKVPYSDLRRTGKIPKMLSHRLFPNARFSLWIDGKLELTVDPYQVLERFLWRTNDTFAISRHYRRFDVFDEAAANKAAHKYNNASIDAQVEFYREEGLTPYTSAKLPITSDVPEGCVIIREHTPITNLFTCLWFNEVDRFTSRDQLSFGIVRDKITAQVPWRVNMFLDCERRNFVVQGYHNGVRRQALPPPSATTATLHPPKLKPSRRSGGRKEGRVS